MKAIKESKLIIADTKVLLRGDCVCEHERLGSFAAEYDGDCDLLIECGPYRDHQEKQLAYTEQNLLFWHDIPGGCRLEVRRPHGGDMRFAFDVYDEWRRASIYRADEDGVCMFEGALGEILFRNAMIPRGGLQVHSVAISYNGKSILFSAPSETGKTTQANFWVNNFGASILHGDRPIVAAGENEVLAYGTPWVGSDTRYQNTRLPVSAIVFIEQAPVNEAVKLDSKEAVKRMLPRCFLPYFSPAMMVQAMSIAESILKRTSCYLLRCKPEVESAELLRELIK